MAVHRGCGANSSLSKEKEFTSLNSLPVVGCPLVNLNPQSSWRTLNQTQQILPIIYKVFYSILLNLGQATHMPGI